MSKKLLVGNWKMNPQSIKEAETLFKSLNLLTKNSKNTEIIICPPFPFLSAKKTQKFTKITVGAQNVSSQSEGPFTGQVSTMMLKSMGIKYAIIGHSESRNYGDTNEVVNKKIILSLKALLRPILCVGESTRDSHGGYLDFIKNQIHECLKDIKKANIKDIVIAYEPIWAIGEDAKREATVEEFTEIKIFIKKIISDMYDAKTAHSINILYGGSVNPKNSKDFIIKGKADGFLVGRDSLNPKKFGAILANMQ